MMLSKVFGEGPQVKLIDFLVNHAEEDFSKTQLADGAQITRPTLYKLLDKLLQEELVIEKKKVGNIQLYQINTDSEIIKQVTSLQGTISHIKTNKMDSLTRDDSSNVSKDKLDKDPTENIPPKQTIEKDVSESNNKKTLDYFY